MTESVKATQAEYHYIDAFRVIRGAGKSDAAKAKAVAQFVADEIARHQPQEREAVLGEAARVADRIATQRRHAQRGNFGNRTCADEAEGASAVAIAIRALKTTPAPAVSRDETNLAAELERLLNKRADRSVPGARVHDALTHFVEKHRGTILSRLRGDG